VVVVVMGAERVALLLPTAPAISWGGKPNADEDEGGREREDEAKGLREGDISLLPLAARRSDRNVALLCMLLVLPVTVLLL